MHSYNTVSAIPMQEFFKQGRDWYLERGLEIVIKGSVEKPESWDWDAGKRSEFLRKVAHVVSSILWTGSPDNKIPRLTVNDEAREDWFWQIIQKSNLDLGKDEYQKIRKYLREKVFEFRSHGFKRMFGKSADPNRTGIKGRGNWVREAKQIDSRRIKDSFEEQQEGNQDRAEEAFDRIYKVYKGFRERNIEPLIGQLMESARAHYRTIKKYLDQIRDKFNVANQEVQDSISMPTIGQTQAQLGSMQSCTHKAVHNKNNSDLSKTKQDQKEKKNRSIKIMIADMLARSMGCTPEYALECCNRIDRVRFGESDETVDEALRRYTPRKDESLGQYADRLEAPMRAEQELEDFREWIKSDECRARFQRTGPDPDPMSHMEPWQKMQYIGALNAVKIAANKETRVQRELYRELTGRSYSIESHEWLENTILAFVPDGLDDEWPPLINPITSTGVPAND